MPIDQCPAVETAFIAVECAAGLVAGPWVGLAVSLFVTWLAVAQHGLPLGSIAPSMLCGGLAGGLLYRWRPRLTQHPLRAISSELRELAPN
jgi:hypothetical protein